jgi:hypothetical protein
MTHAAWGRLGLVSSLVVVSTLSAIPTAAQVETASTTPPTAAYIYIQIQGPQGPVYGFRASSAGHLSAIPGSPFKLAGEIVGATPTKFFTLGRTLIHSYGISSDGAIGAQLSQIAFFDYGYKPTSGQQCGTGGAVLDHTGKYIYVLFGCGGYDLAGDSEYQTYIIHSDGAFSFDGSTGLPECWGCGFGLPSILGNERFAYADESSGHESAPIGFRRESSGTLELMQFSEKDPPLGNFNYYTVEGPDASPNGNYVVFQVYPDGGNPPQLASYTVDTEGNISTTNTSDSMPTTALADPYTTFSPSGNLFVAYENGIEIYKFKGAAPLTLWHTLLTGKGIAQVAFDSSNHLYAMSNSDNKLFVFTMTSTSVTETSSINIGSPFKMVVVSK